MFPRVQKTEAEADEVSGVAGDKNQIIVEGSSCDSGIRKANLSSKLLLFADDAAKALRRVWCDWKDTICEPAAELLIQP